MEITSRGYFTVLRHQALVLNSFRFLLIGQVITSQPPITIPLKMLFQETIHSLIWPALYTAVSTPRRKAIELGLSIFIWDLCLISPLSANVGETLAPC